MNYTANYHLPQWVETDRILMDDFNDMASAIDAALKTNADGLTANDAQHSGFGNCQLYTASYVGTGILQPVTHTFPGKPMALFVADGSTGYGMIAWRGVTQSFSTGGFVDYQAITWGENTVTWYSDVSPSTGLNSSSTTYQILALLERGA